MGIEWRDFMAVGVEEIDNQHKELFRRFNQLLAACDAGKGPEDLRTLAGFLDEYVASHFAAEEKLQQQYRYPDIGRHREQHREFTQHLSRLKKEIDGGSAGLPTLLATNQFIVNWLVGHISKVDKEFGDFIKAGQA